MTTLITCAGGFLFNLLAALLFHAIERRQPFRAIDYRKRLLKDIGALAFVWLIFSGFIILERDYISHIQTLAWVQDLGLVELPLWLRLLLFFLIYDFVSYWGHVLMHHPKLWISHKWHHAPEDIWSLSGVRGSITHVAIYRMAYLSFFLFFFDPIVATILSVEIILFNCWTHMNIKWSPWMRYVEYLIVTPRFHHLHHGKERQFHDKNYGNQLTLWDRLFGTMIAPDSVVQEDLHFGLSDGDSLRLPRAAIGI